jgi:Cu(I)/Ag(I) efflux system membrane fusion protein
MSATAPAERFPGTGVFHATAGDRLNLSHGPIAELGWPAMTMDLGTTAPGVGDGLNAGDRVHFHLVRSDSGGYLIESIEPIAASGTGVIHTVDPAQGLLNMSHDPIGELGWPDMRMDFRVREPGLLDGFRSGDRVAFDLVREASGGYAIVSLQAVAPPAPPEGHDHHEMHGE